MNASLPRRVVAELFGTGFLVAAVVGSGIMGERLANGNVALALLANTVATGAALVALIIAFGPISGAHLNPVVTLMDAFERGLPWVEAPCYIAAQILGGISGAVSAHLMFGLSIDLALHSRPHRACPGLQRIRGDLWPDVRDLGIFETSIECRAFRCRCLHNRRILVHCIHFICQSRRNHRPLSQRYFRRHPSQRHPLVPSRPDRRRIRSHPALSLACPRPPGPRQRSPHRS